ncbi:MAG: right-handed parallel beta-helix repeat-containing protein [Candidatus Heimdallarchaeaceae archaeon]
MMFFRKKDIHIGIIILITFTISVFASTSNIACSAQSGTSINRISADNFTPHDPIRIYYNSNFTDYGFPGEGTNSNPYRIESLEIAESEIVKGIVIRDITSHFIIQYCYIDTFDDAILIGNTSSATGFVYNNTIVNSNRRGMRVIDSPSITIVGNQILNCYEAGIYITSSPNSFIKENKISGLDQLLGGSNLFVESSPYIIIHNNEIINGVLDGIFVTSSPNSAITSNICSNNKDVGIRIENYSSDSTISNNLCQGSIKGIFNLLSHQTSIFNNTCTNNQYGIQTYKSDRLTMKYNVLSFNSKNGIYFSTSSLYGEISYNNLTKNADYGVFLDESAERNIIHHNSFIDNNLLGTSQALDDGSENVWYEESSEEGNYWSEWGSKKPYGIDGQAETSDFYPLQENLQRANYNLVVFISATIIVAVLWKKERQ